MAVFRVERTRDYTVMSNYHLRDKRLSLKAKGLLSQILSLPEDWDYTLAGLAHINRESKDAIRSAVNELEQAGYIQREQTTDKRGRFSSNEYIIREHPLCEKSLQDAPLSENTMTDFTLSEKATQLNTDKQKKEKQNTDPQNTHPFYPPEGENREDGRKDSSAERERIRNQISYPQLLQRHSGQEAQIDELVELLTEVEMNRSPTIRLSRNAELPADYVRDCMRKITADHVEGILGSLQRNTRQVKNVKAYLLSALFKAASS